MKSKKIIILFVMIIIICSLIGGWFYVRSIFPEILSAALRPLGNVLIVPVVSYSILAQLYEFEIKKENQDTLISRLSKANYSADESIMLGNALLIKKSITQHVQFYHEFPKSLDVLNVQKNVIKDAQGRNLRYLSDSSFVILGSCGVNGKWDTKINDRSIILNTRSNFVYKIKDDFFVGFTVKNDGQDQETSSPHPPVSKCLENQNAGQRIIYVI
jgi:hypothetical protein